MLSRHKIVLPQNVCKGLDDAAMDRMIDMTLRMERPLTNALGPEWKEILTREKIRDLYLQM
jgi:3-deoxy-alpha-D-manno-octulosonate 8-oxidase